MRCVPHLLLGHADFPDDIGSSLVSPVLINDNPATSCRGLGTTVSWQALLRSHLGQRIRRQDILGALHTRCLKARACIHSRTDYCSRQDVWLCFFGLPRQWSRMPQEHWIGRFADFNATSMVLVLDLVLAL